MKQSQKQIKRTYYLILFLFWFATGLPMALSVLLMLSRGLSLYQASILMGIYSISIVLLEVPTGGLADAIGRKRVTLMAYSFILLSNIIMLLAFSFPIFLLDLVCYGIGRALASGALDAWFIDSLQADDPDMDLQPMIAQGNTFILLGLGCGLFVGSGLSQLSSSTLPPDGSAILTPYALPIVIAIAVFTVLLALTAILVKEEQLQERSFSVRQSLSNTKQILSTGFKLSRKSKVIPLLLGATFTLGLAMNNLETFWQPHFSSLMNDHNRNNLFFGIIEGGSFAFGILGNQLSLKLKRWLGGRLGWMCAISQGFLALSMILLTRQSVLFTGIGFYWLVGLGFSAHDSPHMTLLNNEIPAKQRSAMLSIASMVSYLGGFIGSFVMGYLADRYSIPFVWLIDALLVAAAAGLYIKIEKVIQLNKRPDIGTQKESAYV